MCFRVGETRFHQGALVIPSRTGCQLIFLLIFHPENQAHGVVLAGTCKLPGTTRERWQQQAMLIR
jgi:hypothetical protein